MKTNRMNISIPIPLKAKLDALRKQGTTASGFIRAVLERELNQTTSGKRGR
jgi:mannitol/fructose-specific phosphotransferase system IIA component